MQVTQTQWNEETLTDPLNNVTPDETAQLLLAFASRAMCSNKNFHERLHTLFPNAHIVGCSTAGEIAATSVFDDTASITALSFDRTHFKTAICSITESGNSFSAGEALAKKLLTEDLVHVFVISDGLQINGSQLVSGIVSALPSTVSITGGLSGDSAAFEKTIVFCDNEIGEGLVTAIGFYGPHFRAAYASLGGWDTFGIDRIVTKSIDNVLYELDRKSALTLYKEYLGNEASDLPASGLRFPLSIRNTEKEEWVVRTILAIDEEKGSITFAGDIPQGSQARLMKANFDRLIDGATDAASVIHNSSPQASPELAILISCVGRKIVLQQRTEEEVEAVRDILGPHPIFTGFYSYGEISPFTPNAKCELHNQTMTITTFTEVE